MTTDQLAQAAAEELSDDYFIRFTNRVRVAEIILAHFRPLAEELDRYRNGYPPNDDSPGKVIAMTHAMERTVKEGFVKDYNKMAEERDNLKGAMNAQDDRERAAGAKCGVPWEEHGCDWPDAVADELAATKAKLARAVKLAAEWEWADPHEPEDEVVGDRCAYCQQYEIGGAHAAKCRMGQCLSENKELLK